jgi:hypothetical protein
MNDILNISLSAAVPLRMLEVADWSFERRADAAAECSAVIAAHGDDLMYGGKHCADAFNKLALGIACAAHQPGGITIFGAHWEAAESGAPS